jgi:hypothetical protein
VPPPPARRPAAAEHAGTEHAVIEHPSAERPAAERPSAVRTADRPPVTRPPAARPPASPSALRPPARRRPGRLRRFVARHGWRAYAIPLLTVVTVLTLVDVVSAGRAAAPAAPAASGAPPSADPAEPTAEPTVPEPVPTAPAEGDAGPTGLPPTPAAGTYVERGAGTVTVVPGTSAVYGTGPLQRFVVEVEDGVGVDGAAFAAAVEATLGDPRSWGGGGRMSFQRVDATAAGSYDFRVSLVSPGSMERYCPGVGTGGYTSCRYGERAVVNLARWETAVPHYEGDIATYRQYVVNHEVGHALGNGHEPCPGPGLPAPVMQQQTLRLDGCTRNAWPFP